jgi:hypothetical protein
MSAEPSDPHSDLSAGRPGAGHHGHGSRPRDPAGITKKNQYSYRDEQTQCLCGPYELATLHFWWRYGLLPDSLQVQEGSGRSGALIDILRAKGLTEHPFEDHKEWVLWMDPRHPFHALATRFTKTVVTSRPQKSGMNFLSLVSPTHQIMVNKFQLFEDFLDQSPVVADEIKDLGLNNLAELFAAWTWKTFTGFGAEVTAAEIKALLLETDPERAKAFFLSKLHFEKEALNIFASYNQWRLFIPIFAVNQ